MNKQRGASSPRAKWFLTAFVLLGGCWREVTPFGSDGGPGADVVPVPAPGSIGTPCLQPSDCTSSVCLPLGLCSRACDAATDCPANWTCSPSGSANLCQCVATPEVCDGRDNDCNGVIDEGLAGCPCATPGLTRCGTECVNESVDRVNCGACGVTCSPNQVCSSSTCQAARLDLLFMVDNSNSMRENQSNLMAQFGPMLQTLTSPPCVSDANPAPHRCDPSNTNDRQSYPPVDDMHVGVVDSDLGTPGSSVPGCSNADLGDDALLNPIRTGQALGHHEPWTTAPPTFGRPTDCTDPNQFPSFIAFSSGITDPVQFTHDFQCNAGLYVAGCGLESQLDAVYRGLIIHDATDHAGNTSPNAGFVRDNALLAIVMLTDEEDGSVRDCRFANGSPCDGQGAIDVYNPVSTAWSAMELNLRFYMDRPCGPQDPTWPLARYIDPANPAAGLLSLKPGHPERVVFSAIVGIPLNVQTVGSGSNMRTDWDALLGAPGPSGRDDFCGRDTSALGHQMSAEGPISMQQANADPNCANRVIPACRREGSTYSPLACSTDLQYFAWPGRRIVEVARRFDQSTFCHGQPCHNGVVTSICGSNYAGAMAPILARLKSRL